MTRICFLLAIYLVCSSILLGDSKNYKPSLVKPYEPIWAVKGGFFRSYSQTAYNEIGDGRWGFEVGVQTYLANNFRIDTDLQIIPDFVDRSKSISVNEHVFTGGIFAAWQYEALVIPFLGAGSRYQMSYVSKKTDVSGQSSSSSGIGSDIILFLKGGVGIPTSDRLLVEPYLEFDYILFDKLIGFSIGVDLSFEI